MVYLILTNKQTNKHFIHYIKMSNLFLNMKIDLTRMKREDFTLRYSLLVLLVNK